MIEMTEEQKTVFFNNWHKQWIEPEIKRRFGEDIPPDFRLRQVLIKLPLLQSPIIELNDEVQWLFNFKAPRDVEIVAGQIVHLYEVVDIEQVFPPEVDGIRVAFMCLYWDGFEYQLFVDFLPNQPDYDPDNEIFKFDGEFIISHVRKIFIERVVRWATQYKTQIREIGLWIAPPLLPYPLSRIVERITIGKSEDARQLLLEYCNADFISKRLVETWHPIKVFRDRQKVFSEALQVHRLGFYYASVSLLINHVEGVIVDWLHELLPPSDVTWKTKSRVTQWREVLKGIPRFEYAYHEALEATLEFLSEDGNTPAPFQAFKNWLDAVDPNFPARHPIGHGKYIPELYTEENSIKLFLLLDTICQFMMFYEVRVLGRDLTQQIDNESK